jgi:hypothetical protein
LKSLPSVSDSALLALASQLLDDEVGMSPLEDGGRRQRRADVILRVLSFAGDVEANDRRMLVDRDLAARGRARSQRRADVRDPLRLRDPGDRVVDHANEPRIVRSQLRVLNQDRLGRRLFEVRVVQDPLRAS